MKANTRILIVDDEDPIRFVLETTLSDEGYEVQTASNGEDAIRLAESNQFDLVMIDLIMPRKDGFETIVALQEIQPGIGIIAMSGGGWKGGTNCYLRVAGRIWACRTLAKPFGRMAMLEAIEGEIGKRESLLA